MKFGLLTLLTHSVVALLVLDGQGRASFSQYELPVALYFQSRHGYRSLDNMYCYDWVARKRFK